MPEVAHKRILVAIETDATRYHGEHASRPRVLGPGETEQILAHLSTDLAASLPQVKSCALSLAGALFDQSQLMRPDFPVYSCLESLLDASLKEAAFEPKLISIGAESGHMPHSELQPADDIPLGLLQTLPIVCSGDPNLIEELSASMEDRFLESGQLSAHSAKALEANYGVAVNHARFMTLTDLNAMFHLQLDHYGFLPLWQLLDAAINIPEHPLSVQGRGGQSFRWTGNAVHCSFETFNYWAKDGAGKAHAADGQLLATGYADWTREYRQYLTTLNAHAVPLEQVLADNPSLLLTGSFLVEESSWQSRQEVVQLTEHSSGDLGTIAVTCVSESGLHHYYPLIPSGLNDLHASIRDTFGVTGAVSFPGCVLYDERSRQLRPDVLQS